MHYNEGANMDTSGTIPKYVNKDVAAGIAGSTEMAEHMQSIVEEMKNVIEAGGETVASSSATDTKDQMKKAIFEGRSLTDEALATDSVTADKLKAGNVYTYHLEDDAVETAKIADNAVTNAKIADGTIQSYNLNTSCVTNEKIAADNISKDKINGLSWSKFFINEEAGPLTSTSTNIASLSRDMSGNGVTEGVSGGMYRISMTAYAYVTSSDTNSTVDLKVSDSSGIILRDRWSVFASSGVTAGDYVQLNASMPVYADAEDGADFIASLTISNMSISNIKIIYEAIPIAYAFTSLPKK